MEVDNVFAFQAETKAGAVSVVVAVRAATGGTSTPVIWRLTSANTHHAMSIVFKAAAAAAAAAQGWQPQPSCACTEQENKQYALLLHLPVWWRHMAVLIVHLPTMSIAYTLYI